VTKITGFIRRTSLLIFLFGCLNRRSATKSVDCASDLTGRKVRLNSKCSRNLSSQSQQLLDFDYPEHLKGFVNRGSLFHPFTWV
jgi:hypothetical protein